MKLVICISKFPGDFYTAGPVTTLGKTLHLIPLESVLQILFDDT